jgi:hypothetical protein
MQKSKLMQQQHQQNSQCASQDSGISSSNSILAPENDDDKTNQQYPKKQRTHNNNKGVAKENASIVGIFPLTDSLLWVLCFRAFTAMYPFLLLLLLLLLLCTKMEHNQIATKSHKDTQQLDR